MHKRGSREGLRKFFEWDKYLWWLIFANYSGNFFEELVKTCQLEIYRIPLSVKVNPDIVWKEICTGSALQKRDFVIFQEWQYFKVYKVVH